jgi:hypothetical protein
MNRRRSALVDALLIATERSDVEKVLELTAADGGASVGACDSLGKTALMYAAEAGNPETMRALLDAGADVSSLTNEGQMTALMYMAHVPSFVLAFDGGCCRVLPAMFGPAIDAPVHGRVIRADPFRAHEDLRNAPLLRGSIAFVSRGGCTFAEKAQRCAEAGAIAVLVANNDAQNPAQIFEMTAHEKVEIGIPLAMLPYEDATRVCAEGRGAGFVTLRPSKASAACAARCVEMLVAAGADINARDDHGTTALMHAALEGQLAVFSALLARGADPSLVAEVDGMDALFIACQGNCTEMVRLLNILCTVTFYANHAHSLTRSP